MRDLSVPIGLLKRYSQHANIPFDASVLVVGAANDDLSLLEGAGFTNVTLSSLSGPGLRLDAEAISLPDNSYDVVFGHAILHHLHCPPKGLAEMLRVARRAAVFFEPNDSIAARMTVRMGLKNAYEIAAVMDHDKGGVCDSDIPNFIYRWTPNELRKAACSAVPQYKVSCHAVAYWDFNASAYELAGTSFGWRLFGRTVQRLRGLLNRLPIIRDQGNHFFGAATKLGYQSWIRAGRFHRSNSGVARDLTACNGGSD